MTMSAITRPDLTLRQRMIMVIDYFVQHARTLQGIQRVAVIGSMVTSKTEPKDLGLLVRIDDHLDLTELATLERRVRGRLLQAGNRGCDVFLADTRDVPGSSLPMANLRALRSTGLPSSALRPADDHGRAENG